MTPREADGTRSLKRHAALIPLSRDHHFALMHALDLRRAAEAPLRAGRGATSVAEGFLAYFQEELIGHLADEEESLLPLTAAVCPREAERLMAEHEDLRERVAVLRQELQDGIDPRRTMKAIGDVLHDHVRFEERLFFERLQEGLSADQLEAVGKSIDAHRAARGRRPGCSLPRR
jgi:hypothetical protein